MQITNRQCATRRELNQQNEQRHTAILPLNYTLLTLLTSLNEETEIQDRRREHNLIHIHSKAIIFTKTVLIN
jgi:hypothetical protein